MMTLDEQEIARRGPVWTALAELFLDTEIFDDQLLYIADTLRASEYSFEEVQDIFNQEVVPVFHTNLSTIAGEWQPWSEEFVKDKVLAYLDKRPTLSERFLPTGWLRSRRIFPVQKQWEALQKLLLNE